ncbi:MAG: 3'-5' exonuclease [Oceanicaulis sp.]
MRFVAIDFETANEQRASPCAVGLSLIEDGRLVGTEEYLIRPPEMRFSSWNIAIHGIRPEDVRRAPELPELFESLRSRLEGATLIAHNASFDMSVLRQTYAVYGLDCLEAVYLCTVKGAQSAWPEIGSAKLNVLADHFGLTLDHHRAGSDAEACARLALMLSEHAGEADYLAAAPKLGITPGRLARDGYAPCSLRRKRARPVPAR